MIAARETIERRRIGGPLDALVVVDRVELQRGAFFQVTAEWHSRGPAPEPGGVDKRVTFLRYYDAGSLELARAIAHVAAEQLRAGVDDVDLQAVARDVKRRQPGLSSRVRRAGGELVRGPGGAVILGDVEPDQ